MQDSNGGKVNVVMYAVLPFQKPFETFRGEHALHFLSTLLMQATVAVYTSGSIGSSEVELVTIPWCFMRLTSGLTLSFPIFLC